jgi:hypothetical protein
MRTAPNTTSKPVIGTAWETKQFIKTDLRWLSLPAAVWLISTAVLFGTLWRTKDSGVPVWKSSPLVLLQCMFSNNGLGWRTEAEKQAEDSCVKLRQSGRGWQLVDRGTELDEE